MSKLKTYHHPEEHLILSLEGSQFAVNLSPGALVRHGYFDGTMGMLIANGDDFVTVLWSRFPAVIDESYVFAPDAMLQVMEAQFAPSDSVARCSRQLINSSFYVTGSVA